MSKPTAVGSLVVKPSILTEAKTLTSYDSGKTYFLNAVGGFTVTLPVPVAGSGFTFIVKTAPTTKYRIATKGATSVIRGQIYTTDINSATSPDKETSGVSYIDFVASTAVVGDSVELISDGTYWYVKGYCSVWNAIGLGPVPLP